MKNKILLIILILLSFVTLGYAQTVTLDYYFNHKTRTAKNGQLQQYHYTWEDQQNTGFSTWGNVFKKNGATLNSLNTAPTLSNLQGSSIYIIVDPDNLQVNPHPNYISQNDAEQVAKWVKAGGVLVLMANDSEHTDLSHFNILATKFGLHFNNDLQNHVIDDAHFNDGQAIIIDTAILKTARQVFLKDVCGLTTNGHAETVLKSADNAAIIATVTKYGKGTVFAVGDPWLYNEYVNGRLPAGFDNDKAADDLAQWLIKQANNNRPKIKTDAGILKLINQNFTDAATQYHLLMQHVPADSLPETYHNGRWHSIPSPVWTSGFYPGTLFELYKATGDTILYHEALRRLRIMEPEQNNNSHDVGFMMNDSYGLANQISPSNSYKQILINSANTLAKRFNPTVGCTLSWASPPGQFKVIIDNMMNLELLMWATKTTGDSSYAKIAISHANTTMKNHFRPDYSSYHLVIYNPETGAVIKKQTVQGAADSSAWARGQAWGLYGFTMMYRETRDPKYLAQANHIANFILSNPNLPADGIPYWDFNAPGIPNAYRDASAGAIYASALIELSGYTDKFNAERYLHAAEKVIKSLSSPKYKAAIGTNGGFILMHSVGNLPAKSLIDVPLTYADYYFVEAMMRYKALAIK